MFLTYAYRNAASRPYDLTLDEWDAIAAMPASAEPLHPPDWFVVKRRDQNGDVVARTLVSANERDPVSVAEACRRDLERCGRME